MPSSNAPALFGNALLGVGFNGDTHSEMHGRTLEISENVKAHGAVGDGTVDDKAAIQQAIDTASAGSTVVFPRGTYRVSGAIVLKSGVNLRGEKATITQANSDNASTFFWDGASNTLTDINIESLTFDGNTAGNTTNCEIFAFGSSVNHARISWNKCRFKNSYTAIRMAGGPFDDVSIDKCRFTSLENQGIGISNTTDVAITNSRFHNCGNCVQIPQALGADACDGVVVANNRFVCTSPNITTYFLHFGGTVADVAASSVSITGNTFKGPGVDFSTAGGTGDQIAVYGVDNVSVVGNTCIEGGDTGIILENCHNGSIVGNTVRNCWGPGVYVSGTNGDVTNCRQISIVGNTCISNSRRGALAKECGILVSALDVGISGNVCLDDTGTPTQLYGVYVFSASLRISLGPNHIVPPAGGDYYFTEPGVSFIPPTATQAVLTSTSTSADQLQIPSTAVGAGLIIGGDANLYRVGANVLGTDDSLRTGKSATGGRPSAASAGDGAQWYDTTLDKPIWSNGAVWKDAAGNAV